MEFRLYYNILHETYTILTRDLNIRGIPGVVGGRWGEMGEWGWGKEGVQRQDRGTDPPVDTKAQLFMDAHIPHYLRKKF